MALIGVDLEFGGNLTLFGNQKLEESTFVLPKPSGALWNDQLDGQTTSMNADLSLSSS
jgi:hypothetical protein